MTTEATDIVELESRLSFDETVASLTVAIERAGATLFAAIDHAGAAEEVGLAMPPTVLLICGNPRGGTPVMQAAPLAALDLPLRVLVREEGGRVLAAYHPASSMLRAAGAPDDLAGRLDGAQRFIAEAIGADGQAS